MIHTEANNIDELEKIVVEHCWANCIEDCYDRSEDCKNHRQVERIIRFLKVGLGLETLDEIEETLIDFYTDKGVNFDEENK